jgi:hypothetical protein
MDNSYLTFANEASVLCGQIAADIRELEEVEATIAKEDREAADCSGTSRTVNAYPVSKVIKPAVSTNTRQVEPRPTNWTNLHLQRLL